MQDDYDVVIVGAGMVGASLACAIAPTNLSIALIESVSPNEDWQPSYDDRGISLSTSSKRVLEHIGVWKDICLHTTPIFSYTSLLIPILCVRGKNLAIIFSLWPRIPPSTEAAPD